jgi:hypothetical protein
VERLRGDVGSPVGESPWAEVERLRGDVGSPMGESPWAFDADDTGVALPRAAGIARSTDPADGMLGG